MPGIGNCFRCLGFCWEDDPPQFPNSSSAIAAASNFIEMQSFLHHDSISAGGSADLEGADPIRSPHIVEADQSLIAGSSNSGEIEEQETPNRGNPLQSRNQIQERIGQNELGLELAVARIGRTVEPRTELNALLEFISARNRPVQAGSRMYGEFLLESFESSILSSFCYNPIAGERIQFCLVRGRRRTWLINLRRRFPDEIVVESEALAQVYTQLRIGSNSDRARQRSNTERNQETNQRNPPLQRLTTYSRSPRGNLHQILRVAAFTFLDPEYVVLVDQFFEAGFRFQQFIRDLAERFRDATGIIVRCFLPA